MARRERLSPPSSEGTRRRLALAGLAVAVGLLHLGLGQLLAERLAAFAAEAHALPPPLRLSAVFVRELLPSPPPALGPAALLPRGPRTVKPIAPAAPVAAPAPPAAASQALADAAPPPTLSDQGTADAPPREPEPPAPEPAAVAAAAPTAEAPAASEPAAPPGFAWPASTRLTYLLNGHYRGPIQGSAQVEWIRDGDRYQVQLDATVGLPVAPLFTRRMTSSGTLGPDGLAPRRYDEETRRAFGETRRNVIAFEREALVLASGERRAREPWPGVQDSASQFVQLTYRFRTEPGLLAVGNVIEVPLALPRSVARWVYDVTDKETLYPDFGPIEAYHLVPRRQPRPGGDLTAEMWFAPALDYLPVRIRIQQDAQSYIDLAIEKPPLQAAPAAEARR